MRKELQVKLEQLEEKIADLIRKDFDKAQKIANLERMLSEKNEQWVESQKNLDELKLKFDQLNIGKAFEGSEETNEEAKRKIDSLIKEINLCITTLKE